MRKPRENVDSVAVTLTPAPAPESWLPMPEGAEARVLMIQAAMAEHRWARGVSGPEVAALWGLTPAALRNYAAEASRRLRTSVDDESLRSWVATSIEDIIAQAEATGSLDTALRGLRTLLEARGLLAHRLEVLAAPPDPERLCAQLCADARAIAVLCGSTRRRELLRAELARHDEPSRLLTAAEDTR